MRTNGVFISGSFGRILWLKKLNLCVAATVLLIDFLEFLSLKTLKKTQKI